MIVVNMFWEAENDFQGYWLHLVIYFANNISKVNKHIKMCWNKSFNEISFFKFWSTLRSSTQQFLCSLFYRICSSFSNIYVDSTLFFVINTLKDFFLFWWGELSSLDLQPLGQDRVSLRQWKMKKFKLVRKFKLILCNNNVKTYFIRVWCS